MAGESPDRAEQQGSSRETTASGGGRDPRLSALRASLRDPEASSGSEPGSGSGSVAPADTASGSGVPVDQPTAVFTTLAPRGTEDDAGKPAAGDEAADGGEETREGAEPEGERLKAAVAAWVATGDAKPEGGEAARAGADDAADAAASADSWFAGRTPAEGPAGAEGAGKRADAPAAEESDAKPAEKPAEVAPGAAAATAGDAALASDPSRASREPDAADESNASGASARSDASDEEPVDQPTRMFKAIRPPVAPAVDQPTTALKLPSGLGAPQGADSDSERTSTFVPLRADIPGERKPAEAPKAAVARTPEGSASGSAGSAASSGAGAPKPASAASVPSAVTPAALSEPERTRQQPMPPLPPLDLLAELTNTPPPPPTALRTTMRRVRIWTPLVLFLLIVFAIVQMVRPLPAPALTLSAAPTYTFEGGRLQMPWPTEGQGAVEVDGVGSMGTWGPQKPAPIASVTKTMTAYVILRDHPIKGDAQGPEITIDQKAADQGKAEHESTAAVRTGQTYTEKELLQLLMIPSANNVARLLARWDAGSEAAFVEKMNAAAKDLGMTQSTYTDPSGLLDSTVSTPQDQLKLAKAVMRYDVFREIVNTPNVTIDGIPGRIENNNTILLEPGVSGIKTGSSTPAGGNLLWAANTVVDGQNRRVLGIVMGAKNAQRLTDKLQLSIDYSLKLIKQAQKDVTSAAVVREGQVVGHVDDGLGGRTPVVATKELKAVGWPSLQVKLELTDGGKAVPHSGKAGDIVGQVSIGEGPGKVSAPVALQTDLVEPGFDKKLTRLG